MEDDKMKAITYNPEREVITTILVLIISFAIITACRAQVLSTQSTDSGPKIGLNDEKAMKSAANIVTESVTRDNNLAVKIKSWMNSGSYWDSNNEEETPVIELAQKIEKWMSDGSFWSTNSKKEIEGDEFAMSDNQENTCDGLVMDEK
jgi:hypothetical protein